MRARPGRQDHPDIASIKPGNDAINRRHMKALAMVKKTTPPKSPSENIGPLPDPVVFNSEGAPSADLPNAPAGVIASDIVRKAADAPVAPSVPVELLSTAATIPTVDPAPPTPPLGPVVKIPKPSFMSKFKSKRPPDIGGVETVLTALKVMRAADANDFFRSHPNEDEYWSCEMCFVSVPILGQKHDTLHVIDEDLAMEYLESKQIKRFRLALATKPHNVFFLCMVPSQNLDNTFNSTALTGCELARTRWVQVLSRKAEGVDEYRIKFTRDEDPFPEPKWPTRSFDELLEVTFRGANIDTPTHPGLLRLIGAKQDLT